MLSVTIGAVVTGTVLVVSGMRDGTPNVVVIMPPVDPNVMVATVSVGKEGIGALGAEFTDTGTVTTVVNGIVPVDPNVIVVTVLIGSDVKGISLTRLVVD